MNPHLLQQKIHSTFNNDINVWSAFRGDIVNSLEGREGSRVFNDHLVREFNRKVANLGFDGLKFEPHDGGYRFIGDSFGIVPDDGFVFVYTNIDEQVFSNEDEAIQVPE